jgi:sec-independent protein translocase protein TatC
MENDNKLGRLDSRGDMSLLEHLEELRKRIVWSVSVVLVLSIVAYLFAEQIFGILAKPLIDALPGMQDKMVFTDLPEVFFVHIKVALFTGIVFSIPFLFYQIWRFVVYALNREEKRLLIPFITLSTVFFVTGALFCYFVVFPWGFRFFIGFSSDAVMPMITLSSYFKFAVRLILVFGIIFEMPILSAFLAHLGIISPKGLRSNRKYAVLGLFALAALITPPDAVTQLMLAGPMLLLYEVSIISAKIFYKC